MSDRLIVARIEQRLTPPLILTDDLRVLRQWFSELMDRMTKQIQTLRLDLDDCVLERSATFRFAGSAVEKTMPVEGLADRRSVCKPFVHNALESDDGGPIEITAVALRAVRVPDFPPQASARR